MQRMRTVGCFVFFDERFLLLHRAPDKQEGDTWALVAGQVEEGEGDARAMVREIREESGIIVDEEALTHLKSFHFIYKDLDVEIDFIAYRTDLIRKPNIVHRPDEHQGFQWMTISECLALPNLIRDLDTVIYAVGLTEKE